MKLKKIAALTAATGGLILAGAGAAMADTSAQGSAWNSPGVGSGNNTQVPVHAPINVTGNGVDVIGVLDWVFGNHSEN
jgi:small secreted domain DUF320